MNKVEEIASGFVMVRICTGVCTHLWLKGRPKTGAYHPCRC